MSERTKWTDEQWEAITGNEKSLLVSVTDEENPVDIDRLLVVTFTNAAATEMRERIAQAISEKLEENPGSANIQRQLTLLGKACITTIHSFCLEVIRSNFQQINIDPGL